MKPTICVWLYSIRYNSRSLIEIKRCFSEEDRQIFLPPEPEGILVKFVSKSPTSRSRECNIAQPPGEVGVEGDEVLQLQRRPHHRAGRGEGEEPGHLQHGGTCPRQVSQHSTPSRDSSKLSRNSSMDWHPPISLPSWVNWKQYLKDMSYVDFHRVLSHCLDRHKNVN